jgi:hypothetical protein
VAERHRKDRSGLRHLPAADFERHRGREHEVSTIAGDIRVLAARPAKRKAVRIPGLGGRKLLIINS